MSIVDATSYISIINSSLPSFVSGFANSFCKVHQVWKGYRRTQEITASAANFGSNCAGWILHFCLGDFKIVQIPARGISIARKTVECIKKQKHFVAAYKELRYTFSEEIFEPKEWVISNGLKFISPSMRTSLKLTLNGLVERTTLLFNRCIKFSAALFSLSMSLMSVLEELSNKKELSDEAVRALFLNSKFLLKELHKHEKEVHATLASLGARYSIAHLTTTASLGVSLLSTFGNAGNRAKKLFNF